MEPKHTQLLKLSPGRALEDIASSLRDKWDRAFCVRKESWAHNHPDNVETRFCISICYIDHECELIYFSSWDDMVEFASWLMEGDPT